MPIQLHRATLATMCLFLSVFLVAPTLAADIKITKAAWKKSARTLTISGRGAGAGKSVRIVDADTGKSVKRVRAAGNGRWSVSVKRPRFVPCKVSVRAGGKTSRRTVSRTPTTCGRAPLSATYAKWDAKNQLVVKGKSAGKRTTVSIRDAKSGRFLGKTRSNSKGRWSLTITEPAIAPCRISVKAGPRRTSRGVVSAPKWCGSPPPIVVLPTIAEAEWHAEDGQLKAKGKGAGRRLPVTLLNADSGAVLATTRSESDGDWEIETKLASGPCRVRVAVGDADAERNVEHPPASCDGGSTPGPGPGPLPPATAARILAANDLGMHCADQDYRIFNILPPFNVIDAQVIQPGTTPRLLTPEDGISVTYHAVTSNIIDPSDDSAPPSATDSINTTSANAAGIYKGNLWSSDGDLPFGFTAFEPLYPPGILGAFPFVTDLGLPAPDVERLYLGDGTLHAEQAAMPGRDTPYAGQEPQPFHAFVTDYPFFTNFGFGYTAEKLYRFRAEGIPVLPIDDAGRANSYPLMRIQAHNSAGEVVAEVDTVVPVASEADCQSCHLEEEVCSGLSLGIPCSDIANYYGRGADFITADGIDTNNPAAPDYVPGDTSEQVALNAAKINILRLHDARHGTGLDAQREITCASCHYSPALDLAQLGPNDENGKEQTQHVSMSRAMHGFHGGLRDDRPNDPDGAFSELFPIMPPPAGRSLGLQEQILGETCYNCHPGKRTECLRGAMETGGVVCQDCHGQTTQVGNDFTGDFPAQPGSPLADLRVPWAEEPQCQSCHVGDVLQVQSLNASGALDDAAVHATDKSGNFDQLRLDLAYALSEHADNGGDNRLDLLSFPDSRFASDLPLYRLSGGENSAGKGHGGLSCEGCHGSTHAIWPNANPWANDNKTAMDLQGHVGTLIECSTCHEGDLGNTLKGPHGMHPVGGTGFAEGGHENLAESNKNACRACHGVNGEGTVLSRAATDRTFVIEECEQGTLCPGGERKNFTVRLTRNQPVTCSMCHENKL